MFIHPPSSLATCGVSVVVLMDGGQPLHNTKMHTTKSRQTKNIVRCIEYSPSQVWWWLWAGGM